MNNELRMIVQLETGLLKPTSIMWGKAEPPTKEEWDDITTSLKYSLAEEESPENTIVYIAAWSMFPL